MGGRIHLGSQVEGGIAGWTMGGTGGILPESRLPFYLGRALYAFATDCELSDHPAPHYGCQFFGCGELKNYSFIFN